MSDGATFRFDNENDTGNLGAEGDDNLNSLDDGGNVHQTPGVGNELKVEVTALEYWRHTGNNPELIKFAGATAQAMTSASTNSIYLNAAGALTIVTTGFPLQEDEEFIPLATVVTNSTVITAFNDKRTRLRLADWQRVPTYTVATLPTTPGGHPLAFASDGVKTGETTGSGTGVLAYFDGTDWKRTSDDSTVIS